MKKRILQWLLPALLAAVLAPAAHAAYPKMRLKLATLAPSGSSYHQSLLRMAEAWRDASGGAVNLVIFADGKLGGEADTVGLMEIGSIQASMLTGMGLANIDEDVTVFQTIPMLFHSREELDYLGSVLYPKLSLRLEEKGYVALFWGDGGFFNFFSKVPVREIGDMRKLKVYAPTGKPEQVEAYQKAGFNTIPLETADIVSSLQTGLIDVSPAPPVYALATQMDRTAPYMLDLNWSPIIGALVIRKDVWEKIPAQLRPVFLKAAETAGKEIQVNSRKETEEAIQAMEKRGLTIIHMEDDKLKEWRELVESSYPLLRGSVIPAEAYDEALELVRAWRESHAGGEGAATALDPE